MNILGVSCFYHDSAACILKDGNIIAAAQEERFTRKKHDHSFPKNAVKFFISYYDYYQPEAYVVSSDLYIEKIFQLMRRSTDSA